MKYLGKIRAMDVSWKIFVGFFVAVVALVTILMSLLLRLVEATQAWLLQIVVGIAVLGFFLLVCGYLKEQQAQKRTGLHPLAFFRRFEFWGSILLLGAGPVYFLTRIANQPMKKVVEQSVPPKVTNIVEAPTPPPPEFPPLHLKGFIYNGPRSAAVINGVTVTIGAVVTNEVRVVSIDHDGVTVELAGQSKVLKLED